MRWFSLTSILLLLLFTGYAGDREVATEHGFVTQA